MLTDLLCNALTITQFQVHVEVDLHKAYCIQHLSVLECSLYTCNNHHNYSIYVGSLFCNHNKEI